MCAIVGLFDLSRTMAEHELLAVAERMAESLRHRGPDDRGVWADAPAGIALGHRRLSIIDLSPSGRQPMISASGRYAIVYNGEIFNFRDLRAELERGGARFRGTSDTEVMLAGFERWGVGETVRRSIGMFAFALWDRERRTLALVRDRLGIKPLYWARFDDRISFGSELHALRSAPGWSATINRDALASYFRLGYVPDASCIFEHVAKVQPGTIVEIGPDGKAAVETYWSLSQAAAAGHADPIRGGDREAIDRLDALLRDAVGRRLISDVPLGAFLSGGVDSSAVVAIMQSVGNARARTFSIGFSEQGFDEAPYARRVAAHLGTDHTELYVTAADARATIPDLAGRYDEPFADSSQIPTSLVCALARRHVTVALSGDGGDELFAGYDRYLWGRRLWRLMRPWPVHLRAALGGAVGRVSPDTWQTLAAILPARMRPSHLAGKAAKFARMAAASSADDMYRSLVSNWDDRASLVIGGAETTNIWDDPTLRRSVPDFVERMQFYDTIGYLPGDILTKIDRASMAFGLEARVPLLDHRVVEFSWRLSAEMKYRGGTTKWILRQVLHRYVPKELIDRPKMGFSVPIGAWLRGPLRDWAETLLAENRLSEEGILDPRPVRAAWKAHLEGKRDESARLWAVLMFQAWRDQWMGKPA